MTNSDIKKIHSKFPCIEKFTLRLFMSFLAKEGILDAYIENIDYNSYPDDVEHTPTCQLLNKGFHWAWTKEGHKYWNDVYVRLKKLDVGHYFLNPKML